MIYVFVAALVAVIGTRVLRSAGGINITLPNFGGAGRSILIWPVLLGVGGFVTWYFWGWFLTIPSLPVDEQLSAVGNILLIAITTYGLVLIVKDGQAVWPKRFGYTFIVVALGMFVWQSVDIDPKEEVFYQQAFDHNTGEPLKMGYVTASGDWIEDPLGRTPTDCRPAGYNHFGQSGKSFPYSTAGTCRSPITGKRLVPISPEYVPDASKSTLPGMLDWVFPTPAERVAAQAARKAKEAAAREAENAKQAAEIALERARYPAPVITPPPPRTAARETPCTGRYENLLNCQRVVFGSNTEYIREARDEYHCLVFDPHDAVKRTDLGGSQYQFIPVRGNAVVQFFDLKKGDTFFGATCK